ncbi:alpha/beta fold hydrolase [Pedobacter sp. SYSU D00535]|uniref:alpha/beta fold hydrolase n=1 Tax=Pedobacter sp. SYSU D00535 TaxID=2810308 RepID=UPI001A960B41|nr:alpha/beta hydrolase [Pedobacter sp. SYSU D00535]
MPLLLLGLLAADLLSLVFLGVDIFLWREWYLNRDTLDDEYARKCLIGAVALLIYIFLGGKSIIKALFSKKRQNEDDPRPEKSREQEELRRADGSLINIEHYGIKGRQAIVFVHGWNSNSMQWYYQKKYFEKDYHLILIDLPGLGKSRRPDNKDFSLENFASVLNDVLEKTKPVNPVLWGHSIGGMTILTFCKVFRQKLNGIKGLVLQHTTYTNPTKTAILSGLLAAIQNPVLKPICWLMIVFSPLVWLSRWMSYANGNMLLMTRFLTFAGTQSPSQLDFASLLSAMAPPAVTARGVLGMFNYDATPVLSEINIPVMIFAASSDRLTKAEASEQMNGRIPGSELIILKPAGHMGLMERHEEVNNGVAEFIRSRGA